MTSTGEGARCPCTVTRDARGPNGQPGPVGGSLGFPGDDGSLQRPGAPSLRGGSGSCFCTARAPGAAGGGEGTRTLTCPRAQGTPCFLHPGLTTVQVRLWEGV